MQYTLASARRILRESSNAYGQNDLRDSINRAIQNLSGMAGWDRLRKVLRFHAVGPHFALPQGCAGIVRVCMNGHPATVRAQDFRFLQSGPGELNRLPPGFCPVRSSNVIDVGFKPVMFEPHGGFRLFAVSQSGGVKIVVRGLAPDGDLVRQELTSLPDSALQDDFEVEGPELRVITEVTLPDAEERSFLYAEELATGRRYPIAAYHPMVEAPEFRHYELANVRPGQPVELLVECRIDPLPLVEETDVLALPSINPVEWMIRGDWCMKANETEAAQKYYGMAANWLKALEVTEATAEVPVVVNSRMLGSPGELTMDAFNI